MSSAATIVRYLKASLAFGIAALSGLPAAASPVTPATISPAALPLYFEAAQGRADSSARFVAHGHRSEFLVSPDAAQLVLGTTAGDRFISSRTLQMRFIDADPRALISGVDGLSGRINYLVGNDPSKWQTGVPIFSAVSVAGIYPGIDLRYYGNGRQLEYDFTIAPGAHPDAIAIHFDGVDQVSVNAAGDLALALGEERILQPAPVIYQIANGKRTVISGGYKMLDAHTVAFSVGDYDRSLPLVIDPILSYSTYFGGTGNDTAWAVAVDTNGFVYIAGQTLSTVFTSGKPFSTTGAFQTTFGGGGYQGDAFIAKFNNSGSNLVYLTYLGGNGDEAAYGLAVDAAGDAYVTGFTDSGNFPVKNALYPTISGAYNQYAGGYLSDGFVAELAAGGSNLVYSTYLGGSGAEAAYGIALDSTGDAYVTGFTFSTNFPVSAAAYQKHLAVSNWVYQAYYNCNAFVSEIAPAGASLLYSSYFGGNDYDIGRGIVVDSSNNVYLTGFTASTNFPATNAIMQTIVSLVGTNSVTNLYNGKLLNGNNSQGILFGYDAFVAKFSPGFSNLIYSTYLGGANDDIAYAIAPDGMGNAYITGLTTSTNFPITVTNLPADQNGLTNNLAAGYGITTNAFLTKIILSGINAAIGPSVVFGGTNIFDFDSGNALALDAAGNIYVAGSSSSTNFPGGITSGSLAATNAGESDAFVIVFSNNISGVIYSAFLGGALNDAAYGIALDPLGNAYLAGQTYSSNFPTNNAMQTALSGASDAFLAKIISNSTPPSPAVSIQGGQVSVTWPSGLPFEPESAHLFALQTATNLPSTNWMTVPGSPILSNNTYSLVFIPTNGTGFYRLELVNP